MIIGTSLYTPALSATLCASSADATELGDVCRIKARFGGLVLGPSLPPAPSGAMVSATGSSASLKADDVISGVNSVACADVHAVQAALLAASGADVQVSVHSPETLASSFDVQGFLGKGTQGTVVLAVSRRDGTEVAVKTVRTALRTKAILPRAMRADLQKYQDDLLRREVELLRLMVHPNACGLLHTFERPGELQLVMELCRGGDLERVLVRRGALPEAEVRSVAAQLFDVLCFMHARHVIHRDVKPANVMIVDGPGPDAFLAHGSLREAKVKLARRAGRQEWAGPAAATASAGGPRPCPGCRTPSAGAALAR